ncbi:hypothetical protein [Krasilnikovia sp. M28-CT-15]|uniref:hypothetical protein n=1 Tax=Krasilnikovia sp. M28-CT-15 TaxID=3373540 RepID=UPI003875B2A4
MMPVPKSDAELDMLLFKRPPFDEIDSWSRGFAERIMHMIGTTEPTNDQLRVQLRQGAVSTLHWLGRTDDPTRTEIVDANAEQDWVNSIDGLIHTCRWFVGNGILTTNGVDVSVLQKTIHAHRQQPTHDDLQVGE